MKTPKAAILLATTLASPLINPFANQVLAQPYWVGQMGDKALIDLDGTLHSLAVGERTADLELAALDQQASVVWKGQPMTLQLGAAKPPVIEKTQLTIRNQGQGFQVAGRLEGMAVGWMVDTGATDVVLSEALARRVGLTPTGGGPTLVTALGQQQGWSARLQRIQVDDWVLTDVPAVIVPGDFPAQPLLGLSALERFRIELSAQKMVLEPAQGSGIIRSP